MAVLLITTIQNFAGLSSDEKPASAPEGSTYHSVDNGEKWVFYNNGWVLDLRDARSMKLAILL